MKRNHRILAGLLCAALLAGAGRASAAKILPNEINPEEYDLNNGEYRLKLRDMDHVIEDGWFTAALYVNRTYDEDRIAALVPGDTIRVPGEDCVVSDVMVNVSPVTGKPDRYEVYTEEGLSLDLSVTGERECSLFLGDWAEIAPVGETRITLPLPDEFAYVAYEDGGDNLPEGAEKFLKSIAGDGRDYTPYNTGCTMKDGQLVHVINTSYPYGPDEETGAEPAVSGNAGLAWEEADEDEPVAIYELYGLYVNDSLEGAKVSHAVRKTDGTLVPDDRGELVGAYVLGKAMYGLVAGKVTDTPEIGETSVYTFTGEDGQALMTLELWNGYIVAEDGLYLY